MAFAVTAHKIQGQTIERDWNVVIDLRSVFRGAQAYVMASRVKELDQLFILEELPENKIYPMLKALEEIERLEEASINNNPTTWDKESSSKCTRICFLNTRSLVHKFDNIKSDLSLQQGDVMILAEIWVQDQEDKKFELNKFEAHLNKGGRGKGLAVYYK